MIRFFDGHNDVLWRLSETLSPHPETLFVEGRPDGHVDLPRARRGGMAGGLCALYAPAKTGFDPAQLCGVSYDYPLATEVGRAEAQEAIFRQIAILLRLVRASEGQVALCRTAGEVAQAMERNAFAVVLHMEGAEAIDPGLDVLDMLHAAGLRSLGPVWSRSNAFGVGVPLRFPSSPDTGPGLTPLGFDLVQACNRLHILVDLSHITEQGFWDVARTSDAPLVATHSNVHGICPSARNLTDRQMDAIKDSDGMVGLNLATSFLRPDGQMVPDTEIDMVVRHIDALVKRLGETRVGLGSDFDGAVVPAAVGDAAGSQAIFAALSEHGYNGDLLERLAVSNWLRVLKRTIG